MTTTTHTMKMALATEADLDVAYDLLGLIDHVEHDYYPADENDEYAPTHLDVDDPEHLRFFYNKLKAIVDRRGSGALHRVVGGFSTVRYAKNQILDLTQDVVELHPRIKAALNLAAQTEHDLYKTGDAGAPDAILDRNGEVVLGLCKRCGRVEAELTEPCTPRDASQAFDRHVREMGGVTEFAKRHTVLSAQQYEDAFSAGWNAARVAAMDLQPVGYFMNTTRADLAPHYWHVGVERKDDPDVFLLYRIPGQDDKNRVYIDRRDLFDFVRGAICAALIDASESPLDASADAWTAAHSRTEALFERLRIEKDGTTEVQPAGPAAAMPEGPHA